MCGIVGILGKNGVAEPIFEALKRLEYRGYDSAGIAVIEGREIDLRRAAGKLGALGGTVKGCAAFRVRRHRSYALGDPRGGGG